MNSEYDIIVIGGGPAGTSTARFAAQNGANVLVLEKRDEIGVPKRCGEGLSIKAMREKGEIQPDPSWALQEIISVVLISPSGTEVKASYPEKMGYTIERKSFDKYLANLAVDAGATVRAGCRVTGLLKDNGKISGVEVVDFDNSVKKIKANIVIAADGVESLAARWAGIKSQHFLTETCTGLQFEMSGIDFKSEKMLEIYMGREIAPGGYIWIFPKGKHTANVGIGIRSNNERALTYLQNFINSQPGLKKGSIIEINGGAIPVGPPLETLTADGFMVVGDAAHQVNAIHGGGIGEAMDAGKLAGRIAAEAVKKADFSDAFLQQYTTEWYAGPGKTLKKIMRLRKVIEKLNDKELDFLAKQLQGTNVVDLAMGKNYSILAKILAKRPTLLRFVPTLLGK